MPLSLRRKAHVLLPTLIVVGGIALALAARWDHIRALPFDFHAARQFHSAQLARSYYVLASDEMPEWKRHISRVRLREDAPIELPIIQYSTATAYRLFDGEQLWLPRLASSLFWIAGAAFLYFLATRFAPWWGAVGAVALYLFLPFPLVASTSFQPDPLMVTLFLAAALAIVRYDERATEGRFFAAVGLSAGAIFIKPGIAAFFLLPLFAIVSIGRIGVRATFASARLYAFSVLSVLPTLGFYAYAAITGQFVTGRLELSVNPGLLAESFFWQDWLAMVENVLRPPFFGGRLSLVVLVVALCALVVARSRRTRAVLLGLWGGYALFGLTVTNYVSTHDYYSLPLVPIAALSLAAVAGAAGEHLRRPLRRRPVRAALTILLVLLVGGAAYVKRDALRLPPAERESERRIEAYEHIGEIVNHTSRALVLGGTGLWHYAWIAGRYWPEEVDLEWEQTYNGLQPINADERFVTTDERYYPAVGTMRPRPTVFIVAEPIELAFQPDLAVLLSDFAALAEAPDYLIFDLTETIDSSQPTPVPGPAKEPPAQTSHVSSFYRFPPTWRGVRRGATSVEVVRVAGQPRRKEIRRDLRKPFEAWFYGSGDNYAIVFVDGEVFAKAQNRR
jgi:Dolichyl-phosphate-mannose-protein mannosyltransferase